MADKKIKEVYRKSVFLVVYSVKNKKVEYLILKRKLHWKGWEFPKGGVNTPEFERHAVKRELYEETGLKTVKIRQFKNSGKYKYEKRFLDRPGIAGQKYRLYAAEVPQKNIKIDEIEHSDYMWVDFKKALKKIKWPNQKKCLKIVDKWLKEKFN